MSIVASEQPSRQGYRSAVLVLPAGVAPARAGEVQPAFFSEASLVAHRVLRSATGGWASCWLDLAVSYQRPGAAAAYQISASALVGRSGGVEVVFLRSCSCPDGQKRVGQSGELRFCKHLVALRSLWLGAGPVGSQHPLQAAFVDAVCSPVREWERAAA